ncbi:hypothetical protein ABGT18_19870 [Pseudomonas putida]|jgi:hypothetical protein|uniref:Uncharacterized protein n=5 Tax=Gammaproteobacteria TaxID=1236 RepID=A0A096XNU9_SERMA|nr:MULTISPECIES: hypothetical protein [Gammaproteobacteria]AVX93408.1 hypothetical protein PkP19E3_35570 [Pseudomonas koreensis]AHC05733.1 hypothetical protein LD209_12 [Pseudomonas putida]AID37287.1 hypothetical protein pDCPR1_20 [Serratia marcescens]KMN16236.1 hypothetical protein TU87_21680 [Pseudomonas weihenstephanensis]MBJ2221484.1 hypothetical protein [Pseudomonas sp. MF7453]
MSFAHIGKIKEVSDFIQANELIEAGYELLQIVPGITSDRDPCTLFYLGQHKPKAADPEGEYVDGEWVPKE